MPILDGVKYACESCIRGHRVSGCTHTDRELKHINPKGRPVRQCEHCRSARKSKSQHAKCDCGEKKEREKTTGALKHDGNTCVCFHGEKCTCGLKKAPSELKLDTSASRLAHPISKARPRATTTNSDTTLTFLANGHHMPCHRNNNSAHTSGLPYKIPRHHSNHGVPHGQLHTYYSPTHESPNFAFSSDAQLVRRSHDDLVSLNGGLPPYGNSSMAQSFDSLPLNGLNATGQLNTRTLNPFQDGGYIPNLTPALSDKERGTPFGNQVSDGPGGLFPFSGISSGLNPPFEDFSTSPSDHYIASPLDHDFGLHSAGINPSWGSIDLPLDPNKLSNSIEKPISHSGESNFYSVPGLTAPSSGSQSEIGDQPFFADNEVRTHPSRGVESFSWDDTPSSAEPPANRNSFASLQDYLSLQGRGPTSAPLPADRRSLDIDLMKGQSPNFLAILEPPRSAPAPNIPSPDPLDATPSYCIGSTPTTMASPVYSPVDYSMLTSAPRSMPLSTTTADSKISPNANLEDTNLDNAAWLNVDLNFDTANYDDQLNSSSFAWIG
ncbi:hypothetical protein M501DRAFT_168635 [Patellaria atrata CBS 101060]|uniref:Copper-fist domain-containing protein n=1 Tax=Patellaria atrata CBS 101060 TaxID=1346257 RepID=A0A9P4VPN3_9PEZI|nr:hypothetical protein M501DRAFT_168635 [Patellaria atrata CBS 101060]